MQKTSYTHIPSRLSIDEQHLLMMKTYELIPDWTRTMFVKKKGTSYLTKDKAMAAAWIQLHENDRHWLIIDFDNNNEWDWKALPLEPNIISYNVENGNHQVFYLLRDAVHCHKAARRNAPYRYLKGLEKELDRQFGGDASFKRGVSKNPFHEKWDSIWIHNAAHTLGELQKGLKVEGDLGRSIKTKTSLDGKEGRNSAIFDKVRFKSYREVEKYKKLNNISLNDWHSIVLDWCRRANSFEDKQPMAECRVKSTAKSIADFAWFRYSGQKKKKVIMSDSNIKKAQSDAAKATTVKKVEQSELAIKDAISKIKGEGKKASKAAVAREVGLSRKQVTTRYSYLFE